MSTLALSEKVCALLGAGMTCKEIAAIAKCDTSTISRIRTGFIPDPKYSTGTAIDLLYAERFADSATAA